MQQDELNKLISEVVSRLEKNPEFCALAQQGPRLNSGDNAQTGIFSTVDAAVLAAEKAQVIFQDLGMEKRRDIIRAMRHAATANAERLAKAAVEETGMGRWQDKLQKNMICAMRSPGVEDLVSRCYTGDKGLTLVEYAPFGVVAAVTPSTNAVATIINNSIIILAGGNSVVFSPHPSARKCVQEMVRLFNGAIIGAGGPPNLVTTIEKPTQESTRELLAHPRARMTVVTGGPAIVKLAMTAGKTCKVIAAGPGNPPIVVDDTALFPQCAESIITGCGFDNNVLCIAEKEVLVLDSCKARFLEAMRHDARAYELTGAQMDQLAKIIISDYGVPGKEPRVNRDFVGHNPSVIGKAIGLNLSDDIRVLWGDVPNDHPFVWTEQLMPVLPVSGVRDFDTAVELAYQMEGGNHHTAGIYSTNIGNLTKMSRRLACSIFVKNAPTIYGLGMGEGYAGMSIGTPTGDGITKPTHFVRTIQCSVVGYLRIA
jgi:propionaldehyde dehydrogenase